MEDEVFEKYFEKLGEIYFLSYAYQYASFKEQDKKSVRTILEEIYNKGRMEKEATDDELH